MMSARARGMDIRFPISCMGVLIMSVLLIYSQCVLEHEVDTIHISPLYENISSKSLENVSYYIFIREDPIWQIASSSNAILDGRVDMLQESCKPNMSVTLPP